MRETMAHLRADGHEVLLVPEAELQSALQIKWELPAPAETGYLVFRAPRSAGFQPAVSPTSSRQGVEIPRGQRIGNPRYGRLEVCATVRLSDLTGVLVRLRQAFQASLAEADDRGYMRAEWSALLYGFLKSLPCPVVNRPRPGAGQRLPEARTTAEALRRAGFVAPQTLATASARAAREFFERNGRRVLCAPPGYSAGLLLEGDSGTRMLSSNARRSFRLQAVPDGRWLRVIVAGGEVFGAEAEGASPPGANAGLWRRARLPAAVASRCARLAASLGLGLVELLVARGEADDFVLAINDFPETIQYEAPLREGIAAALCNVLTGNPGRRQSGRSGVSAERRKPALSGQKVRRSAETPLRP